jgi:hypothetical protein
LRVRLVLHCPPAERYASGSAAFLAVGVTLEELVRLTQRASMLAQRLQQIAKHSIAGADGMVITAELVALEHQIETLIEVVQLRAVRAHHDARPHLAAKRRPAVPLSTDVVPAPVVARSPMGAARQ